MRFIQRHHRWHPSDAQAQGLARIVAVWPGLSAVVNAEIMALSALPRFAESIAGRRQ